MSEFNFGYRVLSEFMASDNRAYLLGRVPPAMRASLLDRQQRFYDSRYAEYVANDFICEDLPAEVKYLNTEFIRTLTSGATRPEALRPTMSDGMPTTYGGAHDSNRLGGNIDEIMKSRKETRTPLYAYRDDARSKRSGLSAEYAEDSGSAYGDPNESVKSVDLFDLYCNPIYSDTPRTKSYDIPATPFKRIYGHRNINREDGAELDGFEYETL
jgi:hypothetical protein